MSEKSVRDSGEDQPAELANCKFCGLGRAAAAVLTPCMPGKSHTFTVTASPGRPCMGCGLPTKLVKIVRGNTFPCCSSEDCYDSVTGRGWRITKDDCIIAPPAVIPASPNASLDRDDYNAELSRRAQSFGYEHRDCNPNGATVMNAIFRLLSDERRETVEACAADYARGRQMGHAEGFAEGQASMTVRGQEQQLDEARRVIASLRAELEDVKVDRDSADQALDRERARTPETVTTVLL